jgi:hypothetical protein
MHLLILISSLFILMISSLTWAEEDDGVVRLQGISIKGNSENPNVLYVTAWQPPPGTGRLYEPVTSYSRHWFQSISRDSLGREMRYGELYTEKPEHLTRLKELLEVK